MSSKKTNSNKNKQNVISKVQKNDPHIESIEKKTTKPVIAISKKALKVGNKLKKSIEKTIPFANSMKNLFNSNLGELNKTIENNSNPMPNSFFPTVEIANSGTALAERIFTSLSSTLSSTLEQNTTISHDLLKCKDAKDLFLFQQKFIETNFSNIMNFCLDVGFACQNYISKNMQISSQLMDNRVKCFSGEMI